MFLLKINSGHYTNNRFSLLFVPSRDDVVSFLRILKIQNYKRKQHHNIYNITRTHFTYRSNPQQMTHTQCQLLSFIIIKYSLITSRIRKNTMQIQKNWVYLYILFSIESGVTLSRYRSKQRPMNAIMNKTEDTIIIDPQLKEAPSQQNKDSRRAYAKD